MPKLKYLLATYARPLYRQLALIGLAIAAAAGIGAAVGYGELAAIAVAIPAVAIAVVCSTVVISAGNALTAAWLHRRIVRFEDAYNAYRKANRIDDPFYEAMDLADAVPDAGEQT